MHGLAKRPDISRNLIRSNVHVRRVDMYEAGAFDDDPQAADLGQAYEARIAALERLVGKRALELELSQRRLSALDHGRETRPCPSSPARGLSVAEGCRLMGIARSPYFDATRRSTDGEANLNALVEG